MQIRSGAPRLRRARSTFSLFALAIVATATMVGASGWLQRSSRLPMLASIEAVSDPATTSGRAPATPMASPGRDMRADVDAISALFAGMGEAGTNEDDLEPGGPQIEVVFDPAADLEDGGEIRWFDGRPIERVGTMRMLVTAYSPDERSCGRHADGITASGYSVWTNGGAMVAADTTVLPFGSLVSVPGYRDGDVVPVLDRGGKIKGHRLDVLYMTHERAMRWGAQRIEVEVWDYADGAPDHFRTSHRRR